MCPWNPNIPLSTDLISNSQSQILQNFQALDPIVTASGQYVLLPVQSGDPTTSATQLALYSKTSALTSQIELYMRRISSGVTIPLSAGSLGNGYSYLPSGLLVKWGTSSVTNPSGSTSVSFPTSASIPTFTNPSTPAVFITPYGHTIPEEDTDTYVRFITSTYNAMTVWCSQRTSVTQNAGIYTFNWIAIGTSA